VTSRESSAGIVFISFRNDFVWQCNQRFQQLVLAALVLLAPRLFYLLWFGLFSPKIREGEEARVPSPSPRSSTNRFILKGIFLGAPGIKLVFLLSFCHLGFPASWLFLDLRRISKTDSDLSGNVNLPISNFFFLFICYLSIVFICTIYIHFFYIPIHAKIFYVRYSILVREAQYLMVSALVSLSRGPGSSPGWGHYVVFLGNGDRREGQRGSRNTPSRFMLLIETGVSYGPMPEPLGSYMQTFPTLNNLSQFSLMFCFSKMYTFALFSLRTCKLAGASCSLCLSRLWNAPLP